MYIDDVIDSMFFMHTYIFYTDVICKEDKLEKCKFTFFSFVCKQYEI